jgi:hypothetical protein
VHRLRRSKQVYLLGVRNRGCIGEEAVIITFTTNYKEDEDFVSINGSRPMAQASMGCRSMFEFANRVGGVSFSDQMIPTWAPAKFHWNKYWYAHIQGHGQVGHGFVDGRVSDALGFKITGKDREHKMVDGWWSAKNGSHLLTGEQHAAYMKLYYDKGIESADEYIVGLFPALKAVETPVVAAKGKAKRGGDKVALV